MPPMEVLKFGMNDWTLSEQEDTSFLLQSKYMAENPSSAAFNEGYISKSSLRIDPELGSFWCVLWIYSQSFSGLRDKRIG